MFHRTFTNMQNFIHTKFHYLYKIIIRNNTIRFLKFERKYPVKQENTGRSKFLIY